ncbi:MAG: hypothetical protein Q9181_002450 [Wetmoreana brouardii]
MTRALKSEGSADYYKTLGLDPSASLADIKKKYYALSKHHHPDRNPHDHHAAEAFVEISEAYATLGNTIKRERYDREIQRSSALQSYNVPRGSHSSSAPYGARPASGLSRRRTQFRGPPPSFFRNGGWGPQGARRQRQANATASAQTSNASGSDGMGASAGGGYGHTRPSDGLNYDVSHFDRDGHIRTQEQQDQRRRRRAGEQAVDYSNGGNVLVNFVFISGILAAACLIPTLFTRRSKNTSENSD